MPLLNTGQEEFLGQSISPDGRQVAYSRPDGDSNSVSIGDIGSPPEAAPVLCPKCGRAYVFSPDGRYLAISPGPRLSQQPSFKHIISLFEVASRNTTPWLEDPTDSLRIEGSLAGKWAIIEAGPPGAALGSGHYYIAPWRPTPIPRSEWVEFQDVPGSGYSPTAPFIYEFKDSQLVVMRFDEKKMSFTDPVTVHMPPGSATEIRPADNLNVRGPGIVFTRRQTNASVWLTKLPPE